jgi:anti-sigma regulatory factor (Ser/Thr protein kinase)
MSPEACLRHNAFVYDSDEEYVARSVTFLREGLQAGEGAIVANTREALADMRDALGADAEQVSFIDVGTTYDRPARTLAAYHRVLVDNLRNAPSVRAVADVQIGPVPEEWNQWVGYEAMTNLAYAHLPAWLVCTYDANTLADQILESASKTHPEMLSDGWAASHDFEDPRDLLHRLLAEPEPLPGLRSSSPGDDVEVFREQLARQLAVERVPDAKALAMLVAGTEVAANAVRYGRGIEEVRTGTADGRFVCEVIDRGAGFDDPATGYLVPREGVGRGLWVARQLTWNVECFQSPRGFTVRLWL